MQFHCAEQEIFHRKIGRRKDEIHGYMVSNLTPITEIVYRETRDYETIQQALEATDYRPIAVGEQWGGGANGWFKLSFTIPNEFRGREVVALLDFGGEACAYIDGKPYPGAGQVPQGDRAVSERERWGEVRDSSGRGLEASVGTGFAEPAEVGIGPLDGRWSGI